MDTLGGGVRSDARERLWRRLLDGELTRVSVACNTDSTEVFKRYIPRSLGLERVWPYAHQQDRRTGVWRTQAEMNRIAEDLAAQDGWICGSGWPTWDWYFIENADVVLVFQSPARGWRIRSAAIRSAVAAALGGVLRAVLRRRRRYGGDETFVKRRASEPRGGYYSRMGQYALDTFPDKTFIINRRQDLKRLRAL